MPTLPSSTLNFAVLAGILLVTPAFAVVSIDYVTIGNAGNAADPADGDKDTVGVQNFGAVAYGYQIARNKILRDRNDQIPACGMNRIADRLLRYGHVSLAA